MSQHRSYEPAALWRRAAARAIDALLSAVLASLVTVAAAVTAGVVTLLTGQDIYFSDEAWSFVYTLMGLLVVAGLIPVVRYEVASTARRGQTFGKGLLGIQVVQCDDQGAPAADLPPPDLRQSIERWALPHGAGLSVGVVAGAVAVPRIGHYGVLVGAGAGVVAWALVYASSLFDSKGRGWHDKAAGTIVVVAPTRDPQP